MVSFWPREMFEAPMCMYGSVLQGYRVSKTLNWTKMRKQTWLENYRFLASFPPKSVQHKKSPPDGVTAPNSATRGKGMNDVTCLLPHDILTCRMSKLLNEMSKTVDFRHWRGRFSDD